MRYWWIFAGAKSIAEPDDVWATAVIGPTEYAVPYVEEIDGLKWVQSISHQPTDADLEAHTPAEYAQ